MGALEKSKKRTRIEKNNLQTKYRIFPFCFFSPLGAPHKRMPLLVSEFSMDIIKIKYAPQCMIRLKAQPAIDRAFTMAR